MIIPNKPMAGFEKHELSIPSPSSVNEFLTNRPMYVLRKLFGYKFSTEPPMERGTATEKYLPDVLNGKIDIDEAVSLSLKHFDKMCNPEMKKYHEEKAVIPYLVRGAYEELKNYGKLVSYQEKIQGKINEYDYYGYTDFVFEKDGKNIIVDLKTTTKKPYKLSSSHARQVSLYSNALQCDACLLYVIPYKVTDRKTKEITYRSEALWYEVEDKEKHINMTYEIIRNMDVFLYNCQDKYEVAKMCFPNSDDWSWNTEEKINARRKVWEV
tara:strand:+ start:21 stop:824 length:804 start_codon:yes stop_codon:yes gene_type:complete